MLYKILLAFWNLIEVQINNSVDAAFAPFKDICYRAKSKMAAIKIHFDNIAYTQTLQMLGNLNA